MSTRDQTSRGVRRKALRIPLVDLVLTRGSPRRPPVPRMGASHPRTSEANSIREELLTGVLHT